MAESKSASQSKPKAPQVRIDSLRGKTFSLPHPGNEGEGLPFEVDADSGLVSVRGGGDLSKSQAETILRLKHLDGAVAA